MSLFTSEITVDNLPLPVDGSGVTQPVSGTVSVGNFPATQPVSGTVAVSNFPATQPVSIASPVAVTGPLTDTQLRATPVPVTSSPITSSSCTNTPVVLTGGTNATLLSANANRKKVIIFAPKATLYIKFGATASSSSFTYIAIAANTTFEITTWIGQIDALSTVNQTVNVSELV